MKIVKITLLVFAVIITSSCTTTKYDLPKKNELVRSEDKVRNVWFVSFLDSDNNRHHDSNVKIVIKRSDWIK